MDRKGALMDNPIVNYSFHIIVGLLFFGIVFFSIVAFQNGEAIYEDLYAKVVVGIINNADPGQEVALDVTRPTTLAFDNKKSPSEIFLIDNVNNRVTVSLRGGGSTSFRFFNDVDVVDWRLETPGEGPERNMLYFRVVERQRGDEIA